MTPERKKEIEDYIDVCGLDARQPLWLRECLDEIERGSELYRQLLEVEALCTELQEKLAKAREVIKPFARWNLSEHWDGCLGFVEPLNPGDEHSPNLDSLRQAAQWMKNNPEPK